jgi:predicted nucleotidyltransferase component of viral defense system
MTLTDSVKDIIDNYSGDNPLYLRNLIKEQLQSYVLNFVYSSSDYNQLIFTGGTCLRKVYGLNRLSEDLDFDYVDQFEIEEFTLDVKRYFTSVLQYEQMKSSISSNKQTAYFKFPLLKELEMYGDGTPEDVFVRCDFSREELGSYTLDKNMITAGSFQFFVNSYDLPTLFANKLAAFLERVFYKGKLQKIPFKGRDVYDLFWLLQLSAKSSYELKINKPRLQVLLKDKPIDKIKDEFVRKVKLIDGKFLYDDLAPLLESKTLLDGFIGSYQEYLLKYIDMVL